MVVVVVVTDVVRIATLSGSCVVASCSDGVVVVVVVVVVGCDFGGVGWRGPQLLEKEHKRNPKKILCWYVNADKIKICRAIQKETNKYILSIC